MLYRNDKFYGDTFTYIDRFCIGSEGNKKKNNYNNLLQNILLCCTARMWGTRFFLEVEKIDDPRLCGSCQTHFLSLAPEIVNNKDKGFSPQNPYHYKVCYVTKKVLICNKIWPYNQQTDTCRLLLYTPIHPIWKTMLKKI